MQFVSKTAQHERLSVDESKLLTPEQKSSALVKLKKYVKHWKTRRRITLDIIGTLLEGIGGSKESLIEDTGVETDKMMNLDIKDYIFR